MRPVTLDVLAVVPEGWRLCAACDLTMAGAGVRGAGAQEGPLPPQWQADLDRLAAVLAGLAARHGDALRIRILDPRSPQGLAACLRHGIHSYPAFVVDGRDKVVGRECADIEQRIASALEGPPADPPAAGARAARGLRSFLQAMRDILYGATIYEMVRDVNKQRGQIERLFLACVFGDFLGVPILPPYYTLRLLPYAVPHLDNWRRSLLRERDLTDLCDQEIT